MISLAVCYPCLNINTELTNSDAGSKQRDILTAFRNLYGDHTVSSQAAVVLQVAQEYGFEHKLHCFVSDNASSNNGEFIKGLNLSPHLELGPQHRIRCGGHIINLVVKATIYGTGVNKFEKQLAQAAPIEQFQLFRRFGVVGKLHNFVNAVGASHKRCELLLNTQKELGAEDPLRSYSTLQLRQDGDVRWHSVYLMLLRCLELLDPI